MHEVVATVPPPLSIREIKERIERQAVQRQIQIERGEVDLPVYYQPVPVSALFDLVRQLEERHDFLTPIPVRPTLLGWAKSLLKKPLRMLFRWPLVRQVEFNAVVRDQALESARQLSLSDKSLGELYAAVNALKQRVHSLSERVRELEGGVAANEADLAPEPNRDRTLCYSVYLDCFKGCEPLLDLAGGQGDFVRQAMAEGFSVAGIEADESLAQDCVEHELPVSWAKPEAYLATRADESLGGLYLPNKTAGRPARQLAELLALCWRKLRKGGVVLVESENPSCLNSRLLPAPTASVELLAYLLESQCFLRVDHIFSDPNRPGVVEVVTGKSDRAFDWKQYQTFAVVGRK